MTSTDVVLGTHRATDPEGGDESWTLLAQAAADGPGALVLGRDLLHRAENWAEIRRLHRAEDVSSEPHDAHTSPTSTSIRNPGKGARIRR